MRNYWTEQEDNILKNYYLENDGFNKINELLPHRNYNAIKARANTYLKLQRKPEYTKDEKFFEIPNIINCAISGLIEADGNIQDKRYYKGQVYSNGKVSLGLQIGDIEMIEKFKELTKYTGKIRIHDNNSLIKDYRNPQNPPRPTKSKMASIEICNVQKWKEDLYKNWNLTPKKSLTMKPPNLTELEHILAFYSGSICGDGCISILNKNLRITLLGTYEFLLFLKRTLDKIIPIGLGSNVIKERKNAKIYIYCITGVKAYIFSKMVLCLDIPRLNRKWDRAREYIKSIETNKQHHSFLFELKNGLSQDVINYMNKYNQNIIIPERKDISENTLNAFEKSRKLNLRYIKYQEKLKTSQIEEKTVISNDS